MLQFARTRRSLSLQRFGFAAGAASGVGDLQTSGAYLNTQLASYGNLQNQVTSSLDFSKNRQTQLVTAISGIEDADLAQSITELNQAQLQQQAALQSPLQRRMNPAANGNNVDWATVRMQLIGSNPSALPAMFQSATITLVGLTLMFVSWR